MADKPDPYDIESLQSAVNDSASRVSTIWISFLIFSLYMLVAVGTVTQRQLFLDEPNKLPVLNIDLPLWWFFLLAPILFVIFHVYVLLQVLLLGRTTAAYNAAVARIGLTREEDISIRQRLANTLFAQIFAGSPREREGFIGSLLRSVVWITLAAAPILIVVAFQFRFLPYHSHIVTWTHRLLIAVELAAFFLIWPLALDAQRNFQSPKVIADITRLLVLPWRLIKSKDRRGDEWLWLRQRAAPLTACLLYFIISLSIATFPGEWHVNLFTGQRPTSVQCNRWLQDYFAFGDLRFDRFNLPHVNMVDDKALAKIEKATSRKKLPPWDGERTQSFINRDFNCSDLSNADLRRVDFSDAHMLGAKLIHADLQGGSLIGSKLQGATIDEASLQQASLDRAELQGASLVFTQLQGASLDHAQLQGALFAGPVNGVMAGAQLQGASLVGANLEGTLLTLAKLQGASLDRAQLQGAELGERYRGGIPSFGPDLRDASLSGAQLQGTTWGGTTLTNARMDGAYVWRANAPLYQCKVAEVTNHISEAYLETEWTLWGNWGAVPKSPATPKEIATFIEHALAKLPPGPLKAAADERMRFGLTVDSNNDKTAAIEDIWNACEKIANEMLPELYKGRLADLRHLVCDATVNRDAIAAGVVRNWVLPRDFSWSFSASLAKALLGEDGNGCEAMKDFDEVTLNKLRAAAAVD
jgi:uncharacterized protein YjbI with pentapeptide repeats